MLKIRRPLGRLIFNMGIAIPGKTVFLIETAPRVHECIAFLHNVNLSFGSYTWKKNRLQWPNLDHVLSDSKEYQNTVVFVLKIITKYKVWNNLLQKSFEILTDYRLFRGIRPPKRRILQHVNHFRHDIRLDITPHIATRYIHSVRRNHI